MSTDHKTILPDPAPAQAAQIIKEWKNSPALQREFRNDFGCYSAYRRAELAGLIKGAK